MREEIFGPLLPVLPYDHLDEAIRDVAKHQTPLALYYFDKDRRRVEYLLANTKAGGVTINDVIFHIGQEDLPFGGLDDLPVADLVREALRDRAHSVTLERPRPLPAFPGEERNQSAQDANSVGNGGSIAGVPGMTLSLR